MIAALETAWLDASPAVQDALRLALLLVPALVTGALALRGQAPGPLVRALLLRFRWTNLLFAGLMALSVGLGVALIAQERAIREGSARAADPFDILVAAPGDEIGLMLSAVYLQPASAPLLGGDVLDRLQRDDRLTLIAPLAFGDSHAGAPVVGTTAAFLDRIGGPLAEGRVWEAAHEAVIGARSPLALGDEIAPAHGAGFSADPQAHDGAHLTVVGRMAPTGGPWDRAVVAPVEFVWAVHGLADGHAPGAERLGPPFDPDHFPGTPAFVISTRTLAGAYAARARHTDATSMAFFPGATLSRLHLLLGDLREAMSLMALAAQGLAAAGVLGGLVALTRLFARRFALLRALGAPRRFVLAVVWAYAATLMGAGAVLGLAVGAVGAEALAGLVSARTDLALSAGIGWAEAHLAAAVFSLTTVLALVPALAAYRRSPALDLRAG
ncbi:putative ABC transport system permease protein [Albimonas donghaensis]|uniref:Putative ABC transport system permease protein n=1 Tax=Albimonas donghaensis TaxID=356660 RepID=A0A1H2SJG8_9RHOB|nr:ABC transporter permease [Albimonas donghaensis]SDW31722.1 putative ABC transport system permease protein [Albimonas donghaensis]